MTKQLLSLLQKKLYLLFHSLCVFQPVLAVVVIIIIIHIDDVSLLSLIIIYFD